MKKRLMDGAWIVVADGHRSKLFRQIGSGKVQLRHVQDYFPENLDNDGPAGVRPPDQSAQDTDEATFAKQLAGKLNWNAMHEKFDQVALIADPQTLGQLRPLLHTDFRSRLVFEMAKTLTNSPIEDIESSVEERSWS